VISEGRCTRLGGSALPWRFLGQRKALPSTALRSTKRRVRRPCAGHARYATPEAPQGRPGHTPKPDLLTSVNAVK
jgi:hypothetical protein